jgi:hypothetical protein
MIRRIALIIVTALLTGCASTDVTEQTAMVGGATKPRHILVYDFIGDPNLIPPDSAAAGKVDGSDLPSPEDIQTATELGALIAERLAADIREMGLSASRATLGAQPAVGDGVLKGYLVSTESGKAGRRFLVGFGSGKSEMETVVEGYQMTPQGLRNLRSGTVGAAGAKTPGVIMPAAVAAATGSPVGLVVVGGVKLYNEASGKSGLEGRAKSTADEIAEQLKIRFKERGWIT